jgi:hypothetical protein
LVAHEVSHWGTRVVHCGDQREYSRVCSYQGEHDKRFYNVLNKVHKQIGTKKQDAKELESRAGYHPPDGWLDRARSSLYRAASNHRARYRLDTFTIDQVNDLISQIKEKANQSYNKSEMSKWRDAKSDIVDAYRLYQKACRLMNEKEDVGVRSSAANIVSMLGDRMSSITNLRVDRSFYEEFKSSAINHLRAKMVD